MQVCARVSGCLGAHSHTIPDTHSSSCTFFHTMVRESVTHNDARERVCQEEYARCVRECVRKCVCVLNVGDGCGDRRKRGIIALTDV